MARQQAMLFLDPDAQEPTRFALIEDVLHQCQGDLFEDTNEGCAHCEYHGGDYVDCEVKNIPTVE